MENKSFEEARAEQDRIMNEIIDVFAKNACTVYQARRILEETAEMIICTTIVR